MPGVVLDCLSSVPSSQVSDGLSIHYKSAIATAKASSMYVAWCIRFSVQCQVLKLLKCSYGRIRSFQLVCSEELLLSGDVLEYHLLMLFCHVLILGLAILFVWSNATDFINKSPPSHS